MDKITFYFTDDFGADKAVFEKSYDISSWGDNFIGVAYIEDGRDKTKLFNANKVLEIDIEGDDK